MPEPLPGGLQTLSARLVATLARAGVVPLGDLAGRDVVELLQRIESQALTATSLARIAVDRLGPSDILVGKRTRDLVLRSLREDEACSLCSVLGRSLENPFDTLLATDFDRSQSLLETLHAFFAVTLPDVEETTTPVQSVEVAGPYVLFPHQMRASLEVRGKLAGNFARVLLHMPTGAGKTRTAVTTIADLLRELDRGSVVVWLAHSEELCEQAFEEAVNAWSRLGSRPLRIHRHFSANRIRDLGQVEDGIIVASLSLLYQDSLRRQSEFLQLARHVRLVVMDEAHQATAPTYSHLLELLQRNARTGVLGLSATPGRSLRDVGQDIALADFFHRQKVTLAVKGYANPIDYLVDQGYLAQMEFVNLDFSGKDFELSAAEIERLKQGFDLPPRVVAQLEASDARNLMIVDLVRREVASGGSVILFALSVGHATFLASVLQFSGVRAAAVTSGTPADKRRQAIRRYKDRDGVDVLCNYGVLTTGFDAPRTNVAFIARPTTSVVLYSQMIGRAARGLAAGGNETCRILTVVDRIPGFRSLLEGFQFWDDIWEGE